MTDTHHSFVRVFKDKNVLLWVAFFLGIGLQAFVILTPGVNTFFSVYSIDGLEWLYVFLLSISPLLVHEIVVFVLFLKRKIKKA